MNSITYIGMDVYSTNYALCAFTMGGQKFFGQTRINPNTKELVKYLETLNVQQGGKAEFVCGYEAGCLGYTLYHKLTAKGYKCVILAPTTIPSAANKIKTNKRDSRKIAKCLAYGTYSPVYVPTDQDNAIKECIRSRDDIHTILKEMLLVDEVNNKDFLAGLFNAMMCNVFVGRKISITTFREGDKADTGQHAAYKRLGFAESEFLTEFGHPTQRLILPSKREKGDNKRYISGQKWKRRIAPAPLFSHHRNDDLHGTIYHC